MHVLQMHVEPKLLFMKFAKEIKWWLAPLIRSDFRPRQPHGCTYT